MKKCLLLTFVVISLSFRTFDSSYFPLSGGSFTQNWTTTTLITANDNWAAVPSIQGFLGQDITTSTGTDPQTLLTTSAVANDLDVIANQSSTAITNGGIAEFDGIPNPTIALQGSGTADAPHIILYLNTIGRNTVRVQYNLRDLDATADNSIQQVALQYRIGSSGNFTNLPAGYVADATTGPSVATLVTAVDVTLPAACDNQSQVEVRILSTNAAGNDEWVGVDDIIISSAASTGTSLTINDVSATEGNAGTTNYVFTVSLSSPAPAGGVTFDIATANNTATTADNDYVAQSLTGQTIAAGNSTYTFTVVVNGDVNIEPNETFFVNILNVTGATVGDGQGQGTITNDDAGCGTTHTIAQVQGSGNTSPITGAAVTIKGIVTGRRTNGFFLQTPDAAMDADPNTSEGIFVFTSSAPTAAAAVGNEVCVAGTVVEFIPTADPYSPAQTEIVSPVVTQLSTGNPLPAPIILTTANTDPSGGLYQLEKFESMRVSVASLTVVAPTQGNLNEANAISTTNGFFYGVITGIARPFREPGIAQPEPLPGGAPLTVTRFDANPELIGIGSSSIGGAAIDVATGAILTNVVGPLDFRSRTYTIDIDPALPPVVSNNGLTFTAVPAPTASELTVATFNVQRFYDDINDPNGDAVLTATAYANRLNKVSLAIRNVLNTPDIIGMVEVEKLSVLQAIANKVNTDAVAAGQPNPNYAAYLVEGNDVGGIDVCFLVNSGRVNVTSVTQYGLTDTYIDPNTGSPALLNDRPPLVLNGTFTGSTCATGNITVIVNHLRSLNSVNDPVDGNRVRTKRARQAEFLANLIQGFQTADPTANIISVGDYNAFEFSDGYVDMIGTIKGSPTPATDVVLASPDLVNPNLTVLADAHPAAQRYSYSFAGNAQVLDHIVVNSNLLSKISRFSYARVDADFPEVYRNDPNRPERISDHDGAVAYILFTDEIPPTIICPVNIITSNEVGQCSAVVNYPVPAASDNCAGTVTVVSTPASGSVFPVGTTTVTATATDVAGNSSSCTFTITVNDTQAPAITCPAPVTVSCANAVPAVNIGSVTASDNCPGVVVTHSGDVISGQTCANRFTITRTYRATDAASNFTECTQIITVNDVTAPVMTCPAAVTVSCASAVPAVNTAAVTANDNCGGAVTITHQGDVISGQTCANRFTITRTYRATDVCGNFAECTQVITVNDVTAPVMTCPAAVTVNCASAVPAVNIAAVTGVSDNCGGAVTITHQGDVISGQTCANRFTIIRTYRATDVCGNFAECTQVITVNDVTAPVMTCPAAVTVSCASAVPAVNIAAVTGVSDNCGGAVTITHQGDVISGQTCANRFTITRTYRATDVCGNFSQCIQVITVNDQTAPVITCSPNLTATTAVGSCTAVVNFTTTATDNCAGAVTIVSSPASGTAFPIGTTTVTSTATDACGNSSSCTFTVTVADGQIPIITSQPVNRTVCAGGSASFSVTAVTSPNAGGPIAYQWQQFNGSAWVNVTTGTGATTSVLTFANVSNLPQNTNTFRVVLTGFCTTVFSNAATLFVNPLPTISLVTSIPPTLLPGQTLSITATVNPAGGSFVWYKNGQVVSGVTGNVLSGLTVDNLATYRAVYTDPNGCVSTSADVTISGQPSNNLYVYPNPNTGVFQVRFYNVQNEAASVIIYDAKGARVYVQKFTAGTPYSKLDIDISRSPAGIYLIEIVNAAGKRIAAKRIVKQN